MADTKISALTAASTLDGTEAFPVVQSSTTKKATVSGLSAILVPVAGTYAAATTDVETTKVTGDTHNRFVRNADGNLEWGSGSATTDLFIRRVSGALQILFDAESNYRFQFDGAVLRFGDGSGDGSVYLQRGSGERLLVGGNGFVLDGSATRLQFGHADHSQTTVGAAGGASALPATPTGYFKVKNAAGTEFVIPYYAVS